jgi:mono/diheme cytochrome c family protein
MKIRHFVWGAVALMGLFAARVWAWQSSDLDASVARGRAIYNTQCVTCHKEKGEGIPEVYPPLAKSDYLMANKIRSVSIVVNGLSGEITVNHAKFDAEMLPMNLPDEQVSEVLNYVRNSWGNKGDAVKTEEVAPQRKKQ